MNFNKIYNSAFSSKNIQLALKNLQCNKGSITPGVDGITLTHLIKSPLNRLIDNTRKRSIDYRPDAVKRVWIEKSNGKLRPIGIPTIRDRLLQQCLKQVLEPICEAKFHPQSFGFRPLRSQKHALARLSNLINKSQLTFAINFDIENFFDTINHNLLIKQC